MKIKLLSSVIFAFLILPSCDDDDSSSTNNGSGSGGTGGGDQQGGEVRSLVDKRVRFIGTSQSTSTTAGVVTTTNSSMNIIDELRADGSSNSNGTVTIDSINSSVGAIPGVAGTVTQVVNEPGRYSFNLSADAQTATLISLEDDNVEFVATLTYTSDTTGNYTQTSDQTINGVRISTNETGTFEILGSL